MSETLVERVAKAIRDVAIAAAHDPVGKTWEEIALVALKAMRDPTEQMAAAASPKETHRLLAKALYLAMIDAAIAEAAPITVGNIETGSNSS